MPGLEPGIQAAHSVIFPRMTALDARVKPAHDEPGARASRRLVLRLVYM